MSDGRLHGIGCSQPRTSAHYKREQKEELLHGEGFAEVVYSGGMETERQEIVKKEKSTTTKNQVQRHRADTPQQACGSRSIHLMSSAAAATAATAYTPPKEYENSCRSVSSCRRNASCRTAVIFCCLLLGGYTHPFNHGFFFLFFSSGVKTFLRLVS